MPRRANHDVETTDWKAVCGRTARTVWREGRASAFPYPYQESQCHLWGDKMHMWVALQGDST